MFGYDNVEVVDSEGRRQHVERRINDAEAVVIRRMFDRCAAGAGLRKIAKELNESGATAPPAQQGRPKAWAPSSVREALHRDLYRGLILWNRTRKRDLWGQTKQRQRPAAEHLEVPAPQLRTVSDALWRAAHERLEGVRLTYLRATDGKLWGRPMSGIEARHLLTGMSRCGVCGGTLVVRSRSHGKRRAFFCACSSFHHRGKAVCANSVEMRVTDADAAVLDALERELLDPSIIQDAMNWAIEQATAQRPDRAERVNRLGAEADKLSGELDRLIAAIVAGGEAATLVLAMREREKRRELIAQELRELQKPLPARQDAAKLKESLLSRLMDWKGLLRAHVPQARQMVRKLVVDRIVFTPDAASRPYTFQATGPLSRFFSGLAYPQAMASPTGTAVGWQLPIAGFSDLAA